MGGAFRVILGGMSRLENDDHSLRRGGRGRGHNAWARGGVAHGARQPDRNGQNARQRRRISALSCVEATYPPKRKKAPENLGAHMRFGRIGSAVVRYGQLGSAVVHHGR